MSNTNYSKSVYSSGFVSFELTVVVMVIINFMRHRCFVQPEKIVGMLVICTFQKVIQT